MILTLKISPSPIDQGRIELIMRAALSNREHKQGWVYKANSDAKGQMRCSTVNPLGRG